MQMRRLSGVLALALALAPLACTAATPQARQPEIRTDDIDRFFKLYDAAHGMPTVDALQTQYLDPGSTGLHQFVQSRIGTAAKLTAAIAKWPAVYADARGCTPGLQAARQQLPAVFARLAEIYPQATFPPVTLLVGRNNTGGVTTADGVVIGLEAACRSTWMQPDIGERLVHLIAHEYVHVQQPAAQVDAPPDATMLFQALLEGGAEFIGELTSGEVSNVHLQRWTRGRACEIERGFQKDAFGSDLSHWLYNGAGTADKPGDLGYWVGYRIVKTYYAQAPDKKAAIATIIALSNDEAGAFLKRSGWTPDTDCRSPPAPSAPAR